MVCFWHSAPFAADDAKAIASMMLNFKDDVSGEGRAVKVPMAVDEFIEAMMVKPPDEKDVQGQYKWNVESQENFTLHNKIRNLQVWHWHTCFA